MTPAQIAYETFVKNAYGRRPSPFEDPNVRQYEVQAPSWEKLADGFRTAWTAAIDAAIGRVTP